VEGFKEEEMNEIVDEGISKIPEVTAWIWT